MTHSPQSLARSNSRCGFDMLKAQAGAFVGCASHFSSGVRRADERHVPANNRARITVLSDLERQGVATSCQPMIARVGTLEMTGMKQPAASDCSWHFAYPQKKIHSSHSLHVFSRLLDLSLLGPISSKARVSPTSAASRCWLPPSEPGTARASTSLRSSSARRTFA